MSQDPRAIGIDIGAGEIRVAIAGEPAVRVPLVGAWHEALAALVQPGSVVAFEATGWHYAAPIVNVVVHLGGRLLQVEAATSKHLRELHDVQKSDVHDAELLALLASDVATGKSYPGAHFLDPATARAAVRLRALVRQANRATSAHTRLSNRFRQLAYSIWPSLGARPGTYQRAVAAGAVTPAELRRLLAALEAGAPWIDQYPTGRETRHLRGLVADLPPPDLGIPTDHLDETIRETVAALGEADTRKQQLDAKIAHTLESEPIHTLSRLWSSVPESSDNEIAAILAACNCAPADYTENALSRACRCAMIRSSSGKVVSTKRDKRGSKLAQAALHTWCIRLHKKAARPNPVADYADRLRARGHKFVMQAARNKLLAILRGIAINEEVCRWKSDN